MDITSQISDKEGAGILNARAARGIVTSGNYWSYTLADSSFPYSKNITIDATANSLTRVAVYWLKRNTSTNNHSSGLTENELTMSNLNLRIYGPDGDEIVYVNTLRSNFEIAQFVPETTGTYRIEISEKTISTTHNEHVGIAIW